MKNELLLLPEKIDSERSLVSKAWKSAGGQVLSIGKFWVKPEIEPKYNISIYGNDTFSLVLAQVLGVNLLSVSEAYIASLDSQWIKRTIQIETKQSSSELKYPTFIKPLKPKLFKAEVYASHSYFQDQTSGIEIHEKLIVSEVIQIDCEVRSFILAGIILDLAIYEGEGDKEDAQSFISSFLREEHTDLPPSYVMDIGFNKDHGWFIIEFNSSWGAGLNHCDPENVISGIQAATID